MTIDDRSSRNSLEQFGYAKLSTCARCFGDTRTPVAGFDARVQNRTVRVAMASDDTVTYSRIIPKKRFVQRNRTPRLFAIQ